MMKGEGSDVSHVGGFGSAGTAGKDAPDAVKGVSDTRPGVPFGRECARILVGGNHWPLPRHRPLAGCQAIA